MVTSYIHRHRQHRPINANDLALFFRQFATLTMAGIPIIQSLELLEKIQYKIKLKILIFTIKRDLLAGKTLSQSIRLHTGYFNSLICQLIHIGEHTGRLDTMLNTIAIQQEKNITLRNQIKQALFYPALILLTACATSLGMFLFVVPRFAELFHDAQVTLPWITVFLFTLSDYLRKGWWMVLGPLCLLYLFNHFFKQERRTPSSYLKNLPGVRDFLAAIRLEGFVRNLAITLAAGIPIHDALRLSGSTSLLPMTDTLRHHLYAGLSLYKAMQTQPIFPAVMLQMVKIGEESGQLEQMLEKVADILATDLANRTERFTKLLEPLIMAILGVLIGGMVIGMYLPIFKLGSTL